MISAGPLSVDRSIPEPDDEVDVDVEQCSDSETLLATTNTNTTTPGTTGRAVNRSTSKARSKAASPGSATNASASDEERLTPEPAQSKSRIVGSCNCEELRPVQCHLETKELWDKFHDLGTEMIITKTGSEPTICQRASE
ncbi:t-box transcription factor tbx20 [Anopheles darlingi]|uniref:T-box transcription factor tbx20 n=1 Tax=Anopheles darlingi TaxID=43151 RepID=W5J5Z6_ANODA|nr:t-box transcription factor tbx20 [Anopheles darlingi]